MTTFYRSKIEKLIEEYEEIMKELDRSEPCDWGRYYGIDEVLDELRKIVDGVR